MKQSFKIILLVSGLLSSQFTLAGGASSFSSFYGGASLGHTLEGDCPESEYSGYSISCGEKDDKAFNSWKAFAGYKVTDSFAIEGAYHNLGSYYIRETSNSYPISTEITGDLSALTLAAVPYKKVSDNVEVFGKFGVAQVKADLGLEQTYYNNSYKGETTEKDTGLLIGAGANVKVSDNFGVRGEYEHLNVMDDGLNTLSFGAFFSSL